MAIYPKLVVILAVIAFLNAVRPACVFACSCAPSESPEQALVHAAAVFSGPVIDVDTTVNVVTKRDRGTVTFAVTRGWKGIDQAMINVPH